MNSLLFLFLSLNILLFSSCFGEKPQNDAVAAVRMRVMDREITVNGKKASVLSLSQTDGTIGLTAKKGDQFNVILENKINVPTSIHWHGLILPNPQDGVAFVTQFPIYPQTQYHYRFPIVQAGTFFMHSHFTLQEQNLLTAPLIFTEEDDKNLADQECVVMLSDFTFTPPSQIFRELRCKKESMDMSGGMSGIQKRKPDVLDVNYDAFLANFKTMDNPEIFDVKQGSRVRLRMINASSATNFFIDLDKLEGEAIAVDGSRIYPMRNKVFELGVAQRIDIVMTIPEAGGAFPIYAKGEDTFKQAGVLLMTSGATKPELSSQLKEKAGILTNKQEASLRALKSLIPKQVDRRTVVELGGNMSGYIWTLNGQSWPEVTPIVVKKGERVEITFKNTSMMTHPMHLHGHVFQVTAMDGVKINGACRDTVLVTPGASVTIEFDADNPGVWPLHCHVLYHLEAGMMTVVRYDGFLQPL